MRRAVAVVVLLCSLGAAAPAALAADQLTVDFETGPALGTAVNDDYLTSDFVRFVQADPGFRPYRKSAPGLARSGTVVADIGPDVCTSEGFSGNDCELVTGGTTGRLTRAASAVTVYAGLFSPAADVNAKLTAYNGSDQVVGTSADVPIGVGFTTAVTVTSPAEDIVRFQLDFTGSGALGAPVGFDDLTLTFSHNPLPDVTLSAPANPVAALAGQSVDVPITVTRLDGSNGSLHFSATGLPTGVTASFVPNPLTGVQTAETLRLTAAPGAPALDNPATVTVTADPQNNASAAKAPRTATLLVRVASPYELRAGQGGTAVALPDCASVDLPFVVARDRAFGGTVKLAVEGAPAGVTAQLLPSDTIAPGGNFFADATLRLSRTTAAPLPADLTVRATSTGLPDRTLTYHLTRAAGSATLASGLGLTPRHLGPGTRIRIDGGGFCPGTTLRVGNSLATADADVAPDGRSLTFNVPRLATSGPVTIVPPGAGTYTTSTPLTVAGFRSVNGFPFSNPSYGSLSLSELTDAFGADDLFIKVNPCWPWGSCTVVTGILDPLAFVEWGIMDILAHESGGHCFGISRAVEQLLNHKVPYNRFASVDSAFALPSPSGPSSGLLHYLDAQHVLQFSDQFLVAWLNGHNAPLADQVKILTDELAAGRDPIVSIQGPDFGEGHAMIAYDAEPNADGGTDIYVYDSNRPFDPGVEADATNHRARETQQSVIHIKPQPVPKRSTWSFDIGGEVWTGGDDTALASDGKLFIAPQSTIPDDPGLPGIGALKAAIGFGSTGGAVKTTGASKGGQLLPALDSHMKPGTAGQWLWDDASGPVEARFEGMRSGRYTQVLTQPGFAGAVVDVPTAAGVRDAASGQATGKRSHGTLRFTSGMARSLKLQLAARAAGGATAWSATLDTHASAKGEDTAGLDAGGAMTYAHDGAPTTLRFALSSIRTDGGPSRFDSGPVAVGRGDKLTVTPAGAALDRVRLTIRTKSGAVRHRMLRNHARKIARLRLSGVRISGGRARARVRVSGLHGRGVLGVAFRLRRGARVVARRAVSVRSIGNGTRTITWRVPRAARSAGRLLVDARLATTGGQGLNAGSVTTSRSLRVR